MPRCCYAPNIPKGGIRVKWNSRLVGVVGLAGAVTMMLSAPAAAAPAVVHSKDFAGYKATSSTGITGFTGTLNLPSVTCPATGSPSLEPQIFLSGDSLYSIDFSEFLGCSNGSPSLIAAEADFCPNAGSSCSPIGGVEPAPGDSLQFAMSENTKTSTTTLKLTDSTKKQTASASVHALLSETGIQAGTSFCCGTGNITPIPSFTPIKFGNLKFNGAILSSFSSTSYEMYDGTTLQAATSSISSTGTFTNTFKHS